MLSRLRQFLTLVEQVKDPVDYGFVVVYPKVETLNYVSGQ